MNKKTRNIIISVVLIVFAVIYTLLVKYVDVQPVGVNNSEIGFATINKSVFDALGENSICYTITKLLGVVSILVAGVYGVIGFLQLIKRKSLFKVDKELLLLAGFYIVVVAIYVFFEKCIINYRPILEDGLMEASYPSSHTLLAVCICGSAIIINKKLFKNDFTKIANIILAVIIVVMAVGRLISGVHWFTDIIGGLVISAALLMTYKTLITEKE